MKRVNIAEFKAHLGRYLSVVRGGGSVVLADRGRPIATVAPFEESRPRKLTTRRPLKDPKSLATMRFAPLAEADIDSLSLLLEERQERR